MKPSGLAYALISSETTVNSRQDAKCQDAFWLMDSSPEGIFAIAYRK
jgi:hypothetical protein